MTSGTFLLRCIRKSGTLVQGQLRCYQTAKRLLENKRGLEIGGPSYVFREQCFLPIYSCVQSVDNCDFSSTTVWAEHSNSFVFDPEKAPGRNFFCDGSDLAPVADSSYDFVLSSHNLEHFANPVKALREWQRVAKPGGILVLALPNHKYTFDHRRKPTPVSHMMADYEANMPESDLTHLPDILANHDLKLDPDAGTSEQFRARSLANFENRCLHHHVFDVCNTRELLTAQGMNVLSVETAWPLHIFAIAKMS
ncbi:MAG: class I SAM-dependent methyltransferase [Terracidiphilus sp.]|jgi:SAM-dependent methyltransferase